VNKSFCHSCHKLVPAERVEREGKVFLVKHCPECGTTEALVSSDAARARAKQSLDSPYPYRGCDLNCPECTHSKRPMYAFVDVTNGCNMNCPICCDGVPAHGFRFDPPLEYFDKLFGHLARFDPPPSIALFGGEPTVRKDLFEIIELARSHGLRRRLLTNGLKLADEDYCRRLLESGTTILLSYDGENPETYRQLRGNPNVGRKKRQAIENIGRLARTTPARLSIISCIGWGLNDRELPDIFRLCHEHRSCVRDLYLMPLTPTWDVSQFDYSPERITTEDVENLVEKAFPGEKVDFLPVGFVAGFATVTRYIGTAALAYRGAHPNCESIFLLVSDGKRYLPITHFLKGSLTELARAFQRLDERLAAREKRWQERRGLWGRVLGGLRLARPVLRLQAILGVMRALLGHFRLGRVFKGKGPGKLAHALGLLMGLALRRPGTMQRHTNLHGVLQLIILPLEDDCIVETARLERCPTLHAYYDPWLDTVKYVPVCAWRFHNVAVMRRIAEYYATPEHERAKATPQRPAAVTSRETTGPQLGLFPCAQNRAASAGEGRGG